MFGDQRMALIRAKAKVNKVDTKKMRGDSKIPRNVIKGERKVATNPRTGSKKGAKKLKNEFRIVNTMPKIGPKRGVNMINTGNNTGASKNNIDRIGPKTIAAG